VSWRDTRLSQELEVLGFHVSRVVLVPVEECLDPPEDARHRDVRAPDKRAVGLVKLVAF
jgi:hypothetical protein